MSDKRQAVVIGGGLGGLSAAIRLRARGWKVSLYETSEHTGGKAGSVTRDGYRFDTGPSLLTMPEVFEELFAEAGQKLEDHITLIPLPEICRYFFSDSTVLHAWADEDRLAREFQKVLGEDPDHLKRFLDYSSRIYDITSEIFLRHSLNEPSTFTSLQFLKSLLRSPRIDPLRTMAQAIDSFFESPDARQLFKRYATYNGSDPFKTPATLNIIPHVEYRGGAWAVDGGIVALPRAMEALARRIGVHVNTGTPVTKITSAPAGRGRRVTGVSVGMKHIEADAVVCNVDISRAYPQLLDEPDAPELERYRSLEPSSSAMVFYWGVKGIQEQLISHNILFSSNYRAEFADIFDRGRMPDDPTVYINITSRTSPSDAPEGGENWFVLVNAPYDNGQDWDTEVARTRKAVVGKLNERLGVDIESMIEVEEVRTPVDIASLTSSYRGALYGISSNSRTSAFLRHPNRSRRYSGLYFCGGSTHPGGGMPLVVLGGKIVSDLILHHES
ncbi:MAG: phytoene desaturase family protein [Spirochaetia bacterium]